MRAYLYLAPPSWRLCSQSTLSKFATDMAGLASWAPGQAVNMLTQLQPIFDTLSAGQFDEGYSKIGTRLAERSCHTVGDVIDNYYLGELTALIRGLTLDKTPKSYVNGLSKIINYTFPEPPEQEAKKRGGNMGPICTKMAPTLSLNLSRYIPDGRVYKNIPTNDVTAYLSDAEKKMLLDAIWLEAQSTLEKSYGEYCPDGMPKRLAHVHRLF